MSASTARASDARGRAANAAIRTAPGLETGIGVAKKGVELGLEAMDGDIAGKTSASAQRLAGTGASSVTAIGKTAGMGLGAAKGALGGRGKGGSVATKISNPLFGSPDQAGDDGDGAAGGEEAADPHAEVRAQIEADEPKWRALNEKQQRLEPGTSFKVVCIADQDADSRIGGKDGSQLWRSYLKWATLEWNGSGYTLGRDSSEHEVITDTHDSKQRGAEFSALQLFQGQLLAIDDRTGIVGEVGIEEAEGTQVVRNKAVWHSEEDRAIHIKGGDGSGDKALKVEWACVKGDTLVVGSTGKEFTAGKDDPDGLEPGATIHERECWIKTVDGGMNVEHVDTRENYLQLRKAGGCPRGGGYMVHEACRWSDVHGMWFFLPRKLSRQVYDPDTDDARCSNLLLGVPESGGGIWSNWQDGSIIIAPVLSFDPDRGCSDIFFVPGTGDCHLFILRTAESEVKCESGVSSKVATYASVIDLSGNVLMPEQLIGDERKFEGATLLEPDEWKHTSELDSMSGVRKVRVSPGSDRRRTRGRQYYGPYCCCSRPGTSPAPQRRAVQASGRAKATAGRATVRNPILAAPDSDSGDDDDDDAS